MTVSVFPSTTPTKASQVALVVKSPPANAGDISDVGSISGLGRSTGGGNGYPIQYSCLENFEHYFAVCEMSATVL